MADEATARGEAEVAAPDLVRVQRHPESVWSVGPGSGVRVSTERVGCGLRVDVAADSRERGSLSRLHLRWYRTVAPGTLILGDAWERSYGDLQWRGLHPERVLPWMVLGHDRSGGSTWGAGVAVRGSAFAGWTVDPEGISLWLDLRTGGGPVDLGDRTLIAAVVRWVQDDAGPLVVQRLLADVLCADALPTGPLVGGNNWYYAYGRDFDAAAVLRDARRIAELVGDHPVRPFGVTYQWFGEAGADPLDLTDAPAS